MTYSTPPRRRRRRRGRLLPGVLIGLLILVLGLGTLKTLVPRLRLMALENADVPQWVDVQLIDIDGASRRGQELTAIRDIVIHYVGNPGTSAQANRDYFNSPDSSVSSHFVVGLKGEVIQCVPLTEKSSASNHRNADTISIEVCHPDETGAFSEETYEALVRLTAWLCDTAGLGTDNIIRHHDVTGKICPKYFVEHEDAWESFKKDVENDR